MDVVSRVVVVLVDLPDEHVRAVRHRTVLPDLADVRGSLDGTVGTPYLVVHERPTPDREGDVEACSPCAPGDPDAVFRPGGRFAATTVWGDDARPPRLLEVHEAVATHARAQGLELTGPPRERCLADGLQVAWPVEEPPTGG